MTTSEIQQALQRYYARLEQILTPDELATYEAYRQRIQSSISHRDPGPVATTAAERTVIDKIADDLQAAALNKQFFVLIGVEHLPQ